MGHDLSKGGKMRDNIQAKVGNIWDTISDSVQFEGRHRALFDVPTEIVFQFCPDLPIHYIPNVHPNFA